MKTIKNQQESQYKAKTPEKTKHNLQYYLARIGQKLSLSQLSNYK